MKNTQEDCILYVSTFPPRECGIATFSADLVNAIDRKFSSSIKSSILAMNRNGTNIYNYPRKVRYQLSDSNIDDYILLAKKINANDSIKLVNIQHEFGIFGGEYGSYLIPFLELLEKPTILTFHSVLPTPNDHFRQVVQALARKVSAIIVMCNTAKQILRNDYSITSDIYVVPHGIPYTPFLPSSIEKKRLGYEDNLVISSFGLLNAGKGYEYVIEALPEVVKQFPNLLYIIVGETHPVVRRQDGEQYRNLLESKVKELGLQKHVKFYNKYVTLKEVIMYLNASDIYISSGLDPNQITSGTLSYALGCGRPVISTPFLHAKEDVTPERGILAEFRDSNSFKEALLKLLTQPHIRQSMASHAYHQTRNMTWDNVAIKYKEIFDKYMDTATRYKNHLPKIRFNHLVKLTDSFGVIQFARTTLPDISSGYTLDDVARALIVSAMHYQKFNDNSKLKLMEVYLKFIKYVQDTDGRFHNIVDASKTILKDEWSEDAHGRTLWALGYLMSLSKIPEQFKKEAKELFDKSLGFNQCINAPRALCYSIEGYHYYNLYSPSPSNESIIRSMADQLLFLYDSNATEDWNWFEKMLTYDNAKLSEALFFAYLSTQEKKYLDIGVRSLNFLISVCFEKDIFLPIGQQGWYLNGRKRAYYDQQPLEASSMVQALVLAARVTQDKDYLQKASQSFNWFLGHNLSRQSLYNEVTGGCYDGLGRNSININQGAESTVSYLIARLALEEVLASQGFVPKNNHSISRAIQE